MKLETVMQGNACVIRIKERLDATTAPELERHMEDTIEKGNHKIVFDLTQLEYVSSAGLRIFLVVAKKLKALKGEMSLAGLQGNIKEVVEISGFPSILPCYDSMEDYPG
ncbi:MAG: STAS domain-containing protein [Desulfobacterales bacterium]|nr:STAS domain-containing protein [Desulfobacterales bacterium]